VRLGSVCRSVYPSPATHIDICLYDTASPTVKSLTFAFLMQIAIAKGLIWCTADIKAAYLNVPRPAGEIPILTKLEPFVAEICGLDPKQSVISHRQMSIWVAGLG